MKKKRFLPDKSSLKKREKEETREREEHKS